ncbi:MAG: hypothetical protein WA814_11745, partial [Candidatus Baltobacteraceae bacterium]
IYLPGTGQPVSPLARPTPTPFSPPTPQLFGATAALPTPAAPAGGTTQPATPGSQILAFNVNGPTTISQTVTVGPNAGGCGPSSGGTTCQLALTLPAGIYTGTVGAFASSGALAQNSPNGAAAIAFTVAPNGSNVLNLTLGGVPNQLVVVPASFMSAPNAQGGIDLYGAGKHPLLVEMLDANQNVIIGSATATFALTQAGGALALAVTQAPTAPNLFYVTVPAGNAGSALLRAGASYLGSPNPCAQAAAVCNGTTRVSLRQVLGVANSNAASVTLYVNGQSAPLATIQSGISNPQALVFDGAGDLFVANQPGSVNVYAPPYSQSPATITTGVNHPQALALDGRGNLFVANGNGSNTVTMYAPPYGGSPSATISTAMNDPVGLALDANANLFVVNAAANTVTEYAPPYTGTPTTISKGLNAPNSLALDGRGNLFVANLNSTPNSVVEFTPPFSDQSTPVATITNGVNEQGTIGIFGSSSLFVPNQGANSVTEYAAPYTAAPTTIVGGQSQPVALAIDMQGNLYVANYGNNTVTTYAPPYSGGSWSTISTGVSAPQALALSPPTGAGPALLP